MLRLLNLLVPFFFIAIAALIFTFGIMLFAYLFVFGMFLSLALIVFSWIRRKFFPPKQVNKPKSEEKKSGRVIDSTDWKEL